MDYIEAAHELENGDIDAFFCTAGLTTTIIEELARECDIRLISIDDRTIEKMLSYSNAYSRYTILPEPMMDRKRQSIPLV